MEVNSAENIDIKREMAELRGLVKETGRLIKQDTMENRNISFNLSEQIKGLDKQQKENIHLTNMLIDVYKQISKEIKKVYTPKDLYELHKQKVTIKDLAMLCDCSESTVKNRIRDYKNYLLDMEV